MQATIDSSLGRREFSGFSTAAAGAGADQVAVPEHCDINHPSAVSLSASPLLSAASPVKTPLLSSFRFAFLLLCILISAFPHLRLLACNLTDI